MGSDGSTYLLIADLDKDMVLILKNSNLKPANIPSPRPLQMKGARKGVRIVELISKSDPHIENLKDDYNVDCPKSTGRKKSHRDFKNGSMTKIPTYYIMIDDEYKNCSNLAKWQQSGNVSFPSKDNRD